jgi:hypothetical protein
LEGKQSFVSFFPPKIFSSRNGWMAPQPKSISHPSPKMNAVRIDPFLREPRICLDSLLLLIGWFLTLSAFAITIIIIAAAASVIRVDKSSPFHLDQRPLEKLSHFLNYINCHFRLNVILIIWQRCSP